MDIKFCEIPTINKTLNDAFKISKTVPFSQNSTKYIMDIFNKIKTKMDKEKSFLKDVECVFIHDFFEKLLSETKKYDLNEVSLDKIKPNSVLIIKCPSIFASYHFIVVVVDETKSKVSVLQSYGSSRRLFHKSLPFKEFISLMQKLYDFDNSSFFDNFKNMEPVESILFDIDIPKYLSNLENYYEELKKINEQLNNENNVYNENNQNDEDNQNDENNDLNEYDDETIEKAKLLKMSPYLYETLEYENKNKSKEVIIKQFTLLEELSSGIQKKKIKSKTKSKHKSKLRKSKRRYKRKTKNKIKK